MKSTKMRSRANSKLLAKSSASIAKAFVREPTADEIAVHKSYFAMRKKDISGEEARAKLAKQYHVKPSRIGFMYWQVQRYKNHGKPLVASKGRLAARARLLASNAINQA